MRESPEMVSLLMQVDLDSRIPPSSGVAELLACLPVEQGDSPPPTPRDLPGKMKPGLQAPET